MVILELFSRIKFWKNTDRLGPDIPWTHYKLHFKKAARNLCQKKFKFFGERAEFRPGAYAIACSKISLGKNVIVRPTTMLFADPRPNGAGITIEDDVLLGSGIHFYVSNHRYDDVNKPIFYQGHYDSKPILVKRGAWIGANAIILPGITVGENSVVGAGSIVTKDVNPHTIVGGNPARVIKNLRE